MTIKSDRWIKKMALEHGMIEPFVESQVRQGVISYGLSSYGYDMRVSREFKVFTNVFNTLVDPKNFDQRSFVDIEAEHIDIPPNSFALARTIEYFRIPRSVLAICLGKSTYARCFRGDTRVALVDGSSATLEEMAKRSEQGEHFWGYSIGANGRIIATLLEHPRYVGTDKLYDILLDNGEHIYCTPDHEFITRDGCFVIADDLRPGSSLMPLYRNLFRGYEGVYQPISGTYFPTHRLADEWNLRHGSYEDTPGTHRHHIDHDRRNNTPLNIQRIPASEHIRYHNAEYYDGPDFNSQEHAKSISEALLRRREDSEWFSRFVQAQSNRAWAFWNDPEYKQERDALIAKKKAYWSDPQNRAAQRERQKVRWDDSRLRAERSELSKAIWAFDDGTRRARQREIAREINIRREITKDHVLQALHEAGSIRGAARLLNCDRAVFRRFPNTMSQFRGTARRNHKVISIENVPGEHDVYCLTVPEAGNFALEAGVFVSNCGIILNTTPFEPGWEGYVTLEVSNTTPLPARIYANEGIGQVLFFESDEECETSYADKKGKYQSQTDITLPRL